MTCDLKYAGYVSRQEQQVARQRRLADKRIPERFDYAAIRHLRIEAREKLTRVRPDHPGPSQPHQRHHAGGCGPRDGAFRGQIFQSSMFQVRACYGDGTL